MPSPKSGNAGSAVSPAAPNKAQEADNADPGQVEDIKAEQRKAQSGKYGSVKIQAHKPPQTQEERAKKNSWIEIELFDERHNPVAGEPYQVVLPDGETVAAGTLDEKGFARVEGIEPGNCRISFPRRHKSCWKRK